MKRLWRRIRLPPWRRQLSSFMIGLEARRAHQSREVFEELSKTLEAYNTGSAGRTTGPLSIGLLFSVVLSPYVVKTKSLLRLIEHVAYLPACRRGMRS